MKIISIETCPVFRRVRPELTMRSALGQHHESRYLLVAVRTDEGLTGWGEFCGTPNWSGETLESAQAIIENYFAPQLIGLSIDTAPGGSQSAEAAFGHVDSLMARCAMVAVGNPFARAALEMALWDLRAKAEGIPVHALLYPGVETRPIPVRGSVAGLEPEKAVARARWFLDHGLRALKVKVGLGSLEDVRRVRAVREAIGPDIPLGMDANGGWSVEQTVACVEELAGCNLQYVEQPVPRGDFVGLRAVKERVHIPVMADELVWTKEDLETLLHLDAADIVSLYPGKMGGLSACLAIARRAAEAGKTVYIGSNLEMDVASAAMAHLAVGLPGADFARLHSDIIGPLYYADPISDPPLRYGSGCALVPEGPGLGVTPLPELRAGEQG